MQIEVIIVGNELLNGKIQDLNAHYLAQELFKNGHQLKQVHIIGDNQDDFFTALDCAQKRKSHLIITGGLGPTKDDLTKSILAKYYNKDIVFNEKALQQTLEHYQRENRIYRQDEMDYHQFPLEFTPLNNSVGFAPGIYYTENNLHIFAAPGVPSELKSMLKSEILPRLEDQTSFKKNIIFKTWKLPESKIFTELCPNLWNDLSPFGEVSSLPHLLGVDIGVSVHAKSQIQLDKIESEISEIIKKSPLYEYIWHIGEESLEEVIVKKASDKKLTIGFSESCTGGLCASRITDISGSSAIFWGSIVSYSNEVKMNCLNVAAKTLEDHGAVSEQTAFEMALGARENLNVDIAVSTTGIAGPGGGSPEKPVGTIGIGISTRDKTESTIYHFQGNRSVLKQRFSFMALFKLLEAIENHC